MFSKEIIHILCQHPGGRGYGKSDKSISVHTLNRTCLVSLLVLQNLQQSSFSANTVSGVGGKSVGGNHNLLIAKLKARSFSKNSLD